jgi:iron complex transport system permease protein
MWADHFGQANQAYNTDAMVLYYANLPRLATAILAGAALGLAGAILQQALRNPLASPTTIGVSSGAHLALVAAGLWAPSLLVEWRAAVAIAGAGGAACLVFAIAAKRDFAPVALILAGLMVSLYCGALATILVLLNDKYLVSLFIWGSGSLSQQGWGIVRALWPEMLACMLAMAVLSRPLAVLQIGDDNARARGVSPAMIRKLCIAVAIIWCAHTTATSIMVHPIGCRAVMGNGWHCAARFREPKRICTHWGGDGFVWVAVAFVVNSAFKNGAPGDASGVWCGGTK